MLSRQSHRLFNRLSFDGLENERSMSLDGPEGWNPSFIKSLTRHRSSTTTVINNFQVADFARINPPYYTAKLCRGQSPFWCHRLLVLALHPLQGEATGQLSRRLLNEKSESGARLFFRPSRSTNFRRSNGKSLNDNDRLDCIKKKSGILFTSYSNKKEKEKFK